MRSTAYKLAVLPVIAALTMTLGGFRFASSGNVARFGSCRANGDFAVCVASGGVSHHRRIYVHASAHPGQFVTVDWSMTCTKGMGAGSKSGSFTAWAGPVQYLRHRLRKPYYRPDFCSVAAEVQLSSSGSIHVWLTAKR